MVDETSDGLKEQQRDHNKSDDSMVCVEFLRVEGNPDTHAHTCYCDTPGDDHPASVGPEKTFEAEETHGYGAERKQEAEGGAHQDCMCNKNTHEVRGYSSRTLSHAR